MNIRRATLGQWKDILVKVINHFPNDCKIAADLRKVFTADPNGLRHLLDAPKGEDRTPKNSLSTLQFMVLEKDCRA